MSLFQDAFNHISDNYAEELNLNEQQKQELASRIVENFDFTEYWNQMDEIISIHKP